jgi:G3E family GTPase
MKNKTRLILVGGFLGAGKTTLLYESTKILMKEGKKVGLITNDQASELVDTAYLLQTKVAVAEVSGSCFCCNFNGFVNSVRQVEKESEADVIISEPVGSCTDLSATIIQPLKDKFKNKVVVSPLTVLADPFKLKNILDGGTGGLHKSAAYIFEKQLEEADIIGITKTDLLAEDELDFLTEKVKTRFPHTKIMAISSRSGAGIQDWLNFVMTNNQTGQRIIDVDYDIYAEGEAVLGWLNTSVSLTGNEINWDNFAYRFLKEFSRKIDAAQISVGHIKLMIQNGTKYLAGNITGDANTLEMRGKAGISDNAHMILNARVGLTPDELDNMVKTLLAKTTGENINPLIDAWKCLSPGYPNPTFRYKKS